MGYFYSRIKPLRSLWIQLRRSYQTPAPFVPNHTFNSQIRVFDLDVIRGSRFDFPQNVRFFAAPVQAKPKPEEKGPSGPRLNEKIKADVVRLVIDEGHVVVSRMEALRRASDLKLDLVEVDRNAKPPVCKLMDYHKQKYKQQLKDKDRAKTKSEVTLRKGDCKEVRFSVKTEQKDLEIKANTIKRLMERGYRVKCMAMGTEEQDLGGLVARLSALIEDVAIVESGPRVEKKQAYILVRHIKFGPTKKGSSAKKVSKTVDVADPNTQDLDSNSSSIIEDDTIEDQSGFETDDETPLEENRYSKDKISVSGQVNSPVTENRYRRPDRSSVIENRYKRPDNPPVESRYNRVNNSMPVENRYNRENNLPATENRYRRDHQYNPNVEGGREREKPFPQFRPNNVAPSSSNSRFPANDPGANDTIRNNVATGNRYRDGNKFDPTRPPRPQGGSPVHPYSDGHRQSG